eukprot:Em0023g536a
MEALAAYSSSDDEGSVRHPSPVAFNPEHSASVLSNLKERCKVQSAPDVPVKLEQTTVLRIDPTAKEVTFNPTYEQLFAPQVRGLGMGLGLSSMGLGLSSMGLGLSSMGLGLSSMVLAGTTGMVLAGTTGMVLAGTTGMVLAGTTGMVLAGTTGMVLAGTTGMVLAGTTGMVLAGTTGMVLAGTTGMVLAGTTGMVLAGTTGMVLAGTTGMVLAGTVLAGTTGMVLAGTTGMVLAGTTGMVLAGDSLFVGPMNPFKSQQQLAQKNILSGHMEPAHFDAFQFENQRRTYHIHGYAIDPSVVEGMAPQSTPFVGDLEQAGEFEGATVFEMKGSQKVGEKRKREQPGDSDKVEGYKGPWRQYVDEVKVAKPTEAQKLILDQMIHSKKRKEKEQKEDTIDETTELHIEDPHDYLGRSFLHIPQDVDVDLRAEDPPEKCYAPKKLLHTWNAHAKGVAAIRLFPKSGHLMLSAGMDSKIKLWEVYKDKRCIRTYTGHGKAVRDICFNSDGSQFISCSYDRYVKQWDTETGKCLGRFTNENKTTPYCIKLNPDPDKQHLFIVGCADKKIYTWDMKSGEIVQEYDRHLGSVNSVTFVDENRRFVSTSDDKSLRVWEWDIPVDMKYIAEPHMHSMPSVTLHPNGKWIACQSMDNQIKVYGVHNNFRLNRKKTFRGHIVAGYACQTDFSPDGSFVLSGDADGKLTLWEWKTTRIFTRFKAHDKVCIGCQWLPHETSKVVTCGWDGFIKLWD